MAPGESYDLLGITPPLGFVTYFTSDPSILSPGYIVGNLVNCMLSMASTLIVSPNSFSSSVLSTAIVAGPLSITYFSASENLGDLNGAT